ncbi:hypothetical protein MVEN_00834900 [Mycena venus]|uniref:F-box domain-containing protein n=1 Tax=Mycena venus TaxID=2733690 RepID=A0A8H6YEV8_9AGAR|nr:hypothetical protein MVEN_00834900 [Mycena venus]
MSSPFASQLGTNYCPRDEELPQIKALLFEPSQRLKRLDDEIAVLQKALDKLSKERDALSAYVEAHEVLMSPIRRLPLDILEHIFVACLPTHRNCVMSAQEAPVILGRICSYWRTISLATPRLWSRLHIVEPTGLEQPNSLNTLRRLQRLEVADLWLRRSGECPLSISLNPSPDPLKSGSSVMSSPGSATNPALFLTALIQFAPRWQNIRLVAQLSALEALSRLTEDDVPLLKQLDIVCFADAQGTNDDQWTLSQCGVLHCPSLSAFSISGSFTPGFGVAASVESADSSLPLVSSMGPNCPKLRTCSVLVDPDAGPPPEEDRSIVECLFLHTLDLLCVDTPIHTSGYLLNRLSLPDLREFTLRGQATPGDSTGDSLLSSLAASSRLEIIHIESGSFTKSH